VERAARLPPSACFDLIILSDILFNDKETIINFGYLIAEIIPPEFAFVKAGINRRGVTGA
jgi:hypothetical protein